jgi:hypothetical protein
MWKYWIFIHVVLLSTLDHVLFIVSLLWLICIKLGEPFMRDINVCWVVWMVDFAGNKILGSLLYIEGVAEFFLIIKY